MKRIITLLIIIIFLISGCGKEIEQPETKSIDLAPTTAEEKIVQDWVKSDKPTIKDDNRVSYIVWHVEWNVDHSLYDVWDRKGKHVGRVSKQKIIQSINQGIPPIVVPVPTPSPMPVPLPPTPGPTPTPTPSPTPAPIPPSPTPSPTPTPTPTPTPSPTPTPTPTPLPNATPPTPTPTPTYPTHCSNNQWDGDESDLNCGGSCQKCPPTGNPTYLSCWENKDCNSGNCDMSQAQPLPAIDPHTGLIHGTIAELRPLAGQTWIIPWQGRCQ